MSYSKILNRKMSVVHIAPLLIFGFVSCIALGEAGKSVLNLNETTNYKKLKWKSGSNLVIPARIPVIKTFQRSNVEIPEHFDSRERWSECASIIRNIRDQGDCGACWAFSSASVMSDRLCIHSNGKIKISVSAQDIVTCCSFCGKGCGGGIPISAFHFWAERGIVSGGEYKSKNGCKSYLFDTCTHVTDYCGEDNLITNEPRCLETLSEIDTPKCIETCDESSNLTFSEDLTNGEKPYYLVGARDIQMEILKNGPVVGTFTLFQDFICYKNGVYHNVGGEIVYGHAVKIIGWGVDNGTDYWLVANSWNKDWADNGFFKFLRGKNDCGIDEWAVAALPKIL